MDPSLWSGTKSDCLRQRASLNSQPERVHAPLFLTHAFFDPCDLVQVKYEMLRQVRQEAVGVTTAAALFGFSRVTFYQVEHRFGVDGLPGLLPQPKGARRAYKLSESVVQALQHLLQDEPTLLAVDLQQRLQQDLGLWVHPRSIERALICARKKAWQCAHPAWHRYALPLSCSMITRISVARPCRRALPLWRGSYWKTKAWQPGWNLYPQPYRSFQNRASPCRLN